MQFWESAVLLLIRFAFAGLYIWAGGRKVMNWHATKEYMREKKIENPHWLLVTGVLMQFIGGLSVALGIFSHFGAVILILFTLPATIIMHDFWNLKGHQRIEETAHFLKDMSIVGGLILFILVGPGRYVIIG